MINYSFDVKSLNGSNIAVTLRKSRIKIRNDFNGILLSRSQIRWFASLIVNPNAFQIPIWHLSERKLFESIGLRKHDRNLMNYNEWKYCEREELHFLKRELHLRHRRNRKRKQKKFENGKIDEELLEMWKYSQRTQFRSHQKNCHCGVRLDHVHEIRPRSRPRECGESSEKVKEECGSGTGERDFRWYVVEKEREVSVDSNQEKGNE